MEDLGEVSLHAKLKVELYSGICGPSASFIRLQRPKNKRRKSSISVFPPLLQRTHSGSRKFGNLFFLFYLNHSLQESCEGAQAIRKKKAGHCSNTPCPAFFSRLAHSSKFPQAFKLRLRSVQCPLISTAEEGGHSNGMENLMHFLLKWPF